MADGLLEAVRGLWLADPDLGLRPLLAKLREQQLDLGAGTKEVREVLHALKAEEGEAANSAPAPPAADEIAPPATEEGAPRAAEEGGAPLPVALSLACFGCARLPSEMDDDREKHPVCPKCVKLKVPTTYWCCVKCPGNPGAWKRHAVYHKKVKRHWKLNEDGGVAQKRLREIAEGAARDAEETGGEYEELLADGMRYGSQLDTRRAARAFREAIALRPDRPDAFFNLGTALNNSGHVVEVAQRFLEAKERYPVGSRPWGRAAAAAFGALMQKESDVAKPEWWNDEGLKALSARVIRAAPDEMQAHQMRAYVLSGVSLDCWEAGPRSAAELKAAATHFDRAAALFPAPEVKAHLASQAACCREVAAAR